MLREARLVGALADTPVPVAPLLATAQAGEVIDVAFYVMGYVSGPVVTAATPERLAVPAVRRRLGESLVDTLAEMHSIDWRGVGLADMGRPDGFNARHLERMGALVVDERGEVPGKFADLQRWLRENVPDESGAAIIHNDYRLGNVILDPDRPGQIAAVLDWELATIGDPLLDLGYFLASWPAAGESLTPTQEFGAAVLEEGWPTREELTQRYAERTGADLTHLPWYTAMVLWKLAVLYEYGRRRAEQGVGDDYYADPAKVESFLAAARRSAGLPVPDENTDPRKDHHA